VCFPFPGIIGGVWVFLARPPSPALIFFSDGECNVIGAQDPFFFGDGEGDGSTTSHSQDSFGNGVEGMDLGGLVFFFFLFMKKS